MIYLNESVGLQLSDGSYDVKTYNNATLYEGEFVVVTAGEYSYILEYTDYTSDDEVILADISTGTEYTISANTEYIYPGDSGTAVKVTAFKPGGAEAIALNNTGGPLNETANLFTENGGFLNFSITLSGVSTVDFQDKVYVTEHSFKTTDAVVPAAVTITVGNDTSKIDSVAASGPTMVADDDNDYKYGITTAGTYVVEDVENEIVTVYTPEEPTPVYVGVGSNPSFAAGEGTAGGTVKQAVQIKNSVSKMESEINTATLDRDLVLLGGPCANSLVAELLEMSATRPACSTEFTAEYPTEGVIKVVSDAFGSGQKALVVAGVDRTATRALAVKVMQGTVTYDA
jgi:hypothetical protein